MHRIESLIEEYQIPWYGFHKWFSIESVLEVLPLRNAEHLSARILDNPWVCNAAEELGPALDVAVLGWIDQVVLMVPFVSEDVPSGLQDGARYLDDFRPDQNGDAMLLVTNRDWLDFLAVDISFDDDRMTVMRLRRQAIPAASFRMNPV